MKSTLLVAVLAAVFSIVISTAASCQVMPERAPKVQTGPVYKNSAFLGWGYTSLNQVNGSRSGLQGVTGSYGRDISDHFGVVVDAAHYAWDVTASNPDNPSVDQFLVGGQVRANLYEKLGGFARGLIGTVHTGGVQIQPGYSFAGGVGIGMDYNHSARWAIRAGGDIIGSAFTLVPYQSGNSTHTRWNARAQIGVVVHF